MTNHEPVTIANSLWNNIQTPFFVLAPMEAVTDTVFRHVITRAGRPDVYFTEFTNATGWAAAGERAIGTRLVKTDDESPIVAQLWGSDPVAMTKLAKHCALLGYDGIDLNTGCPDSSAIKSGSGSALINNPGLAAQLIAACKESGLPVSVKCRLGYSRVDEWREWIGFLLNQDIAALTVHLRTKKEMSKVDAHWELMSEIRQLRDKIAPGTRIIGNGDVRNRSHGLDLITQTGIDGVMIGRGIFHDPFAFARRQNDPTQIKSKTIDTYSKQKELIALLRYHLDLYDAHSDRPFETLKRFFKIYIRDFADASQLRDQLMHSTSTAEVRTILDEFVYT